MGGVIFRAIFLQAAFIIVFALVLVDPHAVLAQPADTGQQQFADAWIAAIKSQDEVKVKALFHPATLACINDANRDYFRFSFKDELQTGAMLGASYKIESVKPLSGPPPLGALPANGFAYPVEPTHQLQIDAETRDHHPMYLIRFLAQANGRWYTVDPCPNAKGLTFFEQQRAEGERQMAEGAARATGMPESLRTEIKRLLAQDHWMAAIDRYRKATGADLGTAAIVIGAMAAKK
jgi:hypothetical protein